MSFTNYHSHTYFCDGKSALEEYVIEAIKQGLKAYGFSSHAPVPFNPGWTMKKEDLSLYLSQVTELKQKYKDDIQIYCGLEVDYIPGLCGPKSELIQSLNLDYTIGAIHFIDAFDDGTIWDIDAQHSLFEKGLKEIFLDDIKAVVKRYYELIRNMAQQETPDVIAHLDKIKTQNPGNKYFFEDEPWYQDEVNKTLDVIEKVGCALEINTRGIYTGKYDELYPSPWIITNVNQRNIPIVLNADAHKPHEVAGCFAETFPRLEEMGITKLHSLLDNEWQATAINCKGLIL